MELSLTPIEEGPRLSLTPIEDIDTSTTGALKSAASRLFSTDTLSNIGRGTAALASIPVAWPAAGIAGLAKTITSGVDEGTKTVNQIMSLPQQAYLGAPAPAGQTTPVMNYAKGQDVSPEVKALEVVGWPFEKLAELNKFISEGKETEPPSALRYALGAVPEAVLYTTGLGALAKYGMKAITAKPLRARMERQTAIAEKAGVPQAAPQADVSAIRPDSLTLSTTRLGLRQSRLEEKAKKDQEAEIIKQQNNKQLFIDELDKQKADAAEGPVVIDETTIEPVSDVLTDIATQKHITEKVKELGSVAEVDKLYADPKAKVDIYARDLARRMFAEKEGVEAPSVQKSNVAGEQATSVQKSNIAQAPLTYEELFQLNKRGYPVLRDSAVVSSTNLAKMSAEDLEKPLAPIKKVIDTKTPDEWRAILFTREEADPFPLSPEKQTRIKELYANLEKWDADRNSRKADIATLKENEYTDNQISKMSANEVERRAGIIRGDVDPLALDDAKVSKLTELEAKTRALADEVAGKSIDDYTPEQIDRIEALYKEVIDEDVPGLRPMPTIFDVVDPDTGFSKISYETYKKQRAILQRIIADREKANKKVVGITKAQSNRLKRDKKTATQVEEAETAPVSKQEAAIPKGDVEKWNDRLKEEGMPAELDFEKDESISKKDMFKSVYTNEPKLISDILKIHTGGKIDADITYSSGKMWNGSSIKPRLKFDLTPQTPDTIQADVGKRIPVADGSLKSIMFDPPFMVTGNKSATTSMGTMANRFTSFNTVDDLWNFHKNTLKEISRVLEPGGKAIVKIQDVSTPGGSGIQKGNQFSSAEMYNFAIQAGLRPIDRVIYVNPSGGMPLAPNIVKQVTARKVHSDYWVFEKPAKDFLIPSSSGVELATNTKSKGSLLTIGEASYLAKNHVETTLRDKKVLTNYEARDLRVNAYKYRPENLVEATQWLEKIKQAEDLAGQHIQKTRMAFSMKDIARAEKEGKISKEVAKYARTIIRTLKEQPTFELELSGKTGDAAGLYEFANNLLTLKDPRVTAHEVMHWAFQNVLSKADRLEYYQGYIDNYYNKNGALDIAKLRAATSDSFNARRNPSELFASRGSDYVNDIVLTQGEKSGFQKVISWFKDLSRKLVGKDYSDVTKLFDKIVDKENRRVWSESGLVAIEKAYRGAMDAAYDNFSDKLVELARKEGDTTQGKAEEISDSTWKNAANINRFIGSIQRDFGQVRELTPAYIQSQGLEIDKSTASIGRRMKRAFEDKPFEDPIIVPAFENVIEASKISTQAWVDAMKNLEKVLPKEEVKGKSYADIYTLLNKSREEVPSSVTLDMLGLQSLYEKTAELLKTFRTATRETPGKRVLAEVRGPDWGLPWDTTRAIFSTSKDPNVIRRAYDGIREPFRSPIMLVEGTRNEKHVYNTNIAEMYVQHMYSQHSIDLREALYGGTKSRLTEAEQKNVTTVLRDRQEGRPDSAQLNPAEQESARLVREWLDTMRSRYKLFLLNQYKKGLNKTEYSAFLDIVSGQDPGQIALKYKRIDAETVADIAARYKEIDNWGIEDYIPNVEAGRFKILADAITDDGKHYKKLVGIGLTERDATRKAVAYLEAHPTISNLSIDTDFKSLLDDRSSITLKQYHAMHNALTKQMKLAVENIDNAVAKQMATRTLAKKFKVTPSDVFSEFTLDRQDILQGEDNIFPVLQSYAYTMEKKMALDPVIDQIKGDLGKMNAKERAFILPYIEAVKGKYGSLDKWVDNILHTYRGYSKFVGGIRTAEANLKLGYRPVAASVNFASGQMHTWTAVGTKAYAEGVRFLGTPEGKVFIKSIEPYLGTSILDIGTSIESKTPIWKPLGMFQKPEPFNREVAVAANYLKAKSEGMSDVAAREDAIRANMVQQFTYNLANLPAFMRGPGGRMIGQFKPYLIKELEFMGTLSGKQWIRYLGMQLALGGPRGYLTVARSIPILASMGFWQEAMDYAEEWMNKNAPIASRGVGALPGLISPELGMDISQASTFQFPTSESDFTGPAISDLLRLYKDVYKPISQYGPYMEDMKKAANVAPIAKHWARLWEYYDSKDNTLRDDQGNKLYTVPSTIPFVLQTLGGVENIDLNRLRTAAAIENRREQNRLGIKSRLANEYIKDYIIAGKPITTEFISKIIKEGVQLENYDRRIEMMNLDPDLRHALKAEIRRRPEILQMYPSVGDYEARTEGQ